MGAFVGFTGASGASTHGVSEAEAAELEVPSDSVTDAAATVESHGSDLLTALADEGILPAASVADLGVESLLTHEEHAEGREGLYSSAVRLDGPTSRVTLRKYVGDDVVKVFVHPEAGEHYAIVHSKDTYDDATIVRAEDGDVRAKDGSIGTEDDYVGYSCETDIYTDCTYNFYPWWSDGTSCYRGETSGCCSEGYRPPPC